MRAITWRFLDGYRDLGLLLLRVGVGVSMAMHGWPKIAGGAEGWEKLGHSIGTLGIHFGYTAFGLAAALSEGLGGVLVAIGLATRPAAAVVAFTMAVAVKVHVDGGDGFNDYSHPLELMFVFLALILIGPGRYSVDARLRG